MNNEIFIIFSYPANVAKSLLDENRDHLPAEARSEITKQGHKVEFLNICIGEFQQHIYVQRLELEDAHLGYVESRREQVRRSCRRLNAFSHRRSPFRFFRSLVETIWRRRSGDWRLETTFGDDIFGDDILETQHGRPHVETIFPNHVWRPCWDHMRPRCETLLICEFLQRAHRFGKRQFQSATKFVGWCATMALTEEFVCASCVRDSPIPMAMTRKWLNSLWGLSLGVPGKSDSETSFLSSVWSSQRRPFWISSLKIWVTAAMIIFYFANIFGVGAICRAKAEISFGIILEVFFMSGTFGLPVLATWLCSVLFSDQCISRLCFRSSQLVPFFARAFDRICWVIFWMFRHLLETVDGVCDIFSQDAIWFRFLGFWLMRPQAAIVPSIDPTNGRVRVSLTDGRSFCVSFNTSLNNRKRGRDRRHKWFVFRSHTHAGWPADKV